jgi:hypothetical protein
MKTVFHFSAGCEQPNGSVRRTQSVSKDKQVFWRRQQGEELTKAILWALRTPHSKVAEDSVSLHRNTVALSEYFPTLPSSSGSSH